MPFFNRRSFLAASVAMSAAPALAQPPGPNPQPAPRQKSTPRPDGVDVVIVGAGAAGIAAARRLIAAGRLVEIAEDAPESSR
jgi:NADPH-dependent 2,4-dienoyl-CoA reductase/sulfur reductase-like enzyme